MRSRRIRPATTAAALFCLSVALTGCDLPRDPQGTTQQVTDTGTLRLGWIEGAEQDDHAQAALDRLQQQTGARLQVYRGDSDKLLRDLADGRIDLVYGQLPAASPWSEEVFFGRALGWRAEPPEHAPVARFVMRQGENGWIMQVEKASRP